MTTQDSTIEARYTHLKNHVAELAYAYYVEDNPRVTDAVYDGLFRELQELEAQNPSLVAADSPTRRVGGAPVKGLSSVNTPATKPRLRL